MKRRSPLAEAWASGRARPVSRGPALSLPVWRGHAGWGTTLFTAADLEGRGPEALGEKARNAGFSRSDVRAVPSPASGPRARRAGSQPRSPSPPRREPALDSSEGGDSSRSLRSLPGVGEEMWD